MHSLTKWGRLDPADRWLLTVAYWSLIRVNVTFRICGFRRMMTQCETVPTTTDEAVTIEHIQRAQRYAYWIAVASRRHVVPARCLQRSLVLHSWLRHERLPSALRIGVRQEGGELKAHAWIELRGHVVNDWDEAVKDFTPLARREGQLFGI